jgi:hypothetical protein
LEISALSCMFQCPIQYISSRQGDTFNELVTMEHNASLHGWWRRYKRQYNLAEDLHLKPLTLIYEKGRHWQSSEPLMPQVSTSAAGGTALATSGFSKGVHGSEAPAAGAPSRDEDGTPTAGGAALAAPGSAHGVRRAQSPVAGAPPRVFGGPKHQNAFTLAQMQTLTLGLPQAICSMVKLSSEPS